jgi:hypothetical protein
MELILPPAENLFNSPDRVSACIFFGLKIPLNQHNLKKRFTAKANRTFGSQAKKEEKKGLECKNLFDFFAFVVKFLPKPGSFPEHESKRRCPVVRRTKNLSAK